jgi:hypothetical protein
MSLSFWRKLMSLSQLSSLLHFILQVLPGDYYTGEVRGGIRGARKTWGPDKNNAYVAE